MNKLTVEYQVVRSKDYQSVRVGGAVDVEIEAGEDKKVCFEKARTWLSDQCNAAADEELERVLYGGRDA